MKRRGRDCRFGVVSMCIGMSLVTPYSPRTSSSVSKTPKSDLHIYIVIKGTGMGAAAVFERGDACDDLLNVRKVGTHNFLSKDAK